MKMPRTDRRFMCRTCGHETCHWPIASGRIEPEYETPILRELGFRTAQIMRCHDCSTITSMVNIYLNSRQNDSESHQTFYYPPLIKRAKPKWYEELDDCYKAILKEVYSAVDYGLFFLASSGTRTALDELINEKIGDIGSFEKKLDTLEKQEVIDNDEKLMLEAVIDAGSASCHRSFKPLEENMMSMIDILESIFFKLLIEPEQKKSLRLKAIDLKEATPQRTKPSQKGKNEK